jgi:hypothetical protein
MKIKGVVVSYGYRTRTSWRTPQPTFCTTTTKKKVREKNTGKKSTGKNSKTGQGIFRSRDFVTSGEKVPLGRILRKFRLRMRIAYFRTGPLPVT